MALDIGAVVEDSARRTLQRNGLMLAAAFFLLNLVGAFMGVRSGAASVGVQPTVGMDPVTAGILGVVVSLLSLMVSIAALRVFVTDETDTVPDAAFKRRMGGALLHMIIGGIIFGIAVGIGFILLVVPGVYLLLALFFWPVYVVVEDQSFYEAMQSSWAMTKGHKWRLLGLGIVIALVNILLGAVGGVAVFAGNPMTGSVVMQAFSAIGGVFALAAQARAYTEIAG
ncbi:MAG: hypothetical protein SVW77_02105 [Candidatus Nanohaloarchaea archaeon]|nr:hypothetical protein [Candidatus Nanohaloarchaea archaeon]